MNTSFKVLPIVLISALTVINAAFAQQQNRLKLDLRDSKSRKVEITGVVAKKNKYSIDVDAEGKQENVRVDKQTEFILELASPRIDFSESKLRIPIRKTKKQFRVYSVSLPVFIRATFAHKNQYIRFKNSTEKRIGNYEISTRPLKESSSDKKRIYLTGKLNRGSDDRNVVLISGDEEIKIMLAKNGQWSGFTLADVTAGNTETRIVAVRNENGIVARKIYFWPIQRAVLSQ